MFRKAKEDEILNWTGVRQIDRLGKYLMSGSVHGKPGLPTAELARIQTIVTKRLHADEVFKLGKVLIKRPEYTARSLAVNFIESGWPQHKEVEKLMLASANDEDWIVREFAAETFARLLQKDFPHFSKLYLKWVKTESVNVKRAIALAVKYDSKTEEPKKWKIYLGLIEPLLSEDAEYIRKNLGPFAIGDGLLNRYPDKTISACQKWALSRNENVRWNAAMVFSAVAARKFAKGGRPILDILRTDEVPAVKRAAEKALRNLAPKTR